MRILNLYSGIGGNRKLWDNEHEITAVENSSEIYQLYRKLYPQDRTIMADAHKFLKDHFDEYDFIWSSPPCQKHSKMMKATRHKVADFPDMKLYEEIIFLKHFFKGKWVVENVSPYYEPLIKPSRVLGRHLFWSNFEIGDFEAENIKGFIDSGTVATSKKLKEWLGIEYAGNIYYRGNHCPNQVLRNCVHPDLGLHVFNCATKSTTA